MIMGRRILSEEIAETDATEQEAQEREFKKQIAEMDAIERAQEREFEKQIAEYNAKNPIKK